MEIESDDKVQERVKIMRGNDKQEEQGQVRKLGWITSNTFAIIRVNWVQM